MVTLSDVVLEARPWPRGFARTNFVALVLALASRGLALASRGLVLVMALALRVLALALASRLVLGLGLVLEDWPWSCPFHKLILIE